MAREINRLSARKVQALSEPGRPADGGGLYLVIDASGPKRWVMLYRMPGRRREMGLGAVSAVSLARARELAGAAWAQIAEGTDRIEARTAAVAPPPPPAPVTFADVAETSMADRDRTWRNAAHRAQWRLTPEIQAASLWRMPVADIGTDDVLAVLRSMRQPYVHGWHIEAICAHLEAITRGLENRLLIDVPPGTMKSLLVSVFWPVWEWGPCGLAGLRYLTTAYEDEGCGLDSRSPLPSLGLCTVRAAIGHGSKPETAPCADVSSARPIGSGRATGTCPIPAGRAAASRWPAAPAGC